MSSPLRKASMSGSSAISSRATSGRRPQIAKVGVVDDVRRAYRTGSSIAALARAHRVSRGAIRTAVADLLPGRPGATGGQHGQRRRGRAGEGASGDPRQDRPSPARPQRPGARPNGTPCGKDIRVRRGQGYRLHVTAAPHVHYALLAAAAPLGADGAARKAYRIYADRLTAAAILTDPAR
jgi:hypothetical protein